MKVLSRIQAQHLDQRAQELGIDGVLLMEHAAAALYERVVEATYQYGKCVGIVCGSGNNGGDGYALARLLAQRQDISLRIVKVGSEVKTREATVFAHLACASNIAMAEAANVDFTSFDVIVDCLFGIGLDREITNNYAHIIQKINAANAYVIACDIASGIHADSGLIMGCAIKAQETVSFACGKMGLYFNEGIEHSGKITIADITIPASLCPEDEGLHYLDKCDFQRFLPKRHIHSHKGSYGKLLLIGGRSGMSGAALLAMEAALRCGVGTGTLMSDPITLSAAAVALPEAMHLDMVKQGDETIRELLAQYDVIAIGNGLGRDEHAAWLVEQVWRCDRPAIFDGDALYLLAHQKKHSKRQSPYVITPHPKELSYLLGIEVQEVLKSPLEALKQSERAYSDGVLVLKNTSTMITNGQYRCLYHGGNDGLAKGGSGDVLCGMIAGFLAQSDALSAAICAVILHAYCADLLMSQMCGYAMLPSDVIDVIPLALKQLMHEKRVD